MKKQEIKNEKSVGSIGNSTDGHVECVRHRLVILPLPGGGGISLKPQGRYFFFLTALIFMLSWMFCSCANIPAS